MQRPGEDATCHAKDWRRTGAHRCHHCLQSLCPCCMHHRRCLHCHPWLSWWGWVQASWEVGARPAACVLHIAGGTINISRNSRQRGAEHIDAASASKCSLFGTVAGCRDWRPCSQQKLIRLDFCCCHRLAASCNKSDPSPTELYVRSSLCTREQSESLLQPD